VQETERAGTSPAAVDRFSPGATDRRETSRRKSHPATVNQSPSRIETPRASTPLAVQGRQDAPAVSAVSPADATWLASTDNQVGDYGYEPYLLCRAGSPPDAGVLLMRTRDSDPIIPNEAQHVPHHLRPRVLTGC
jgi:hypothetical protein